MPQRQTKFSETWLSSVDSNGQRIGEWCRKGQNEYQAYCQFCDVQVKCDNAGKTQLLQHSKQKKHIDAIKHSVDKKQKKLVAFSKQSGESSACSSQSLGLITPGDSMNAEIFWLASVKREEAMDELDEIRKRRKSLDKSTHKLLDQALPSKETSKSKRKLESEEKSQKKLKK